MIELSGALLLLGLSTWIVYPSPPPGATEDASAVLETVRVSAEVVNLFNDFRFTEENALRICQIVRDHVQEWPR